MSEIFSKINSLGKRTFGRKFSYKKIPNIFAFLVNHQGKKIFLLKWYLKKKHRVAERAMDLKSVDVGSRTSPATDSLCASEQILLYYFVSPSLCFFIYKITGLEEVFLRPLAALPLCLSN